MSPIPGARSGMWAVVPVKRLAHAKTRLGAVLTGQERHELARAMLADVLETLAQVDELAGMLVVTADAEAADLARSFGARILHDVAEAGVNAAVRQAFGALRREGRDAAMIVPADVPFATTDEFRSALAASREHAVVLVPATIDGGTNLLALQPPGLIEPDYGPDSFARHLDAARRAGVEPAVLALPGIGFDIDEPPQLAGLPQAGGRRTAALLAELGVQTRPDPPSPPPLGILT